MGAGLRLARIPRAELDRARRLPDCSPLSDPWMWALDNGKSKADLSITCTPLAVALDRLVRHCQAQPGTPVEGYARRPLELELARRYSTYG